MTIPDQRRLLIRVESLQLPSLRRLLRQLGAARRDYRLVERHHHRVGIALATADRRQLETIMTWVMRRVPRAEFGAIC